MRILVDNNLSPRICSYLDKSFPGSKHVSDFNLDENTDDSVIWKYATNNHFVILTKDTYFEALSRLLGCPPKVIQLICGNKRTSEIVSILADKANVIADF